MSALPGRQLFSTAFAAALAIVVPQPASAQQPLADPLPAAIEKGTLRVAAVPFVQAGQTNDPVRPRGTNNAYARIQYLLPVPGGLRLAFNDIRGILYLTDHQGRPPTAYLDLRDQGVAFTNANFPNEAGFMGFAFHPQFAAVGEAGYGKLYTAFSARADSGVADYEDVGATQDSVILEWTATDAEANVFAGTWREVMRVGQFAPNHNVGTIAFNPNANAEAADFGLLYICFGDGGSANDPRDHGQTLTAPLGAIARIDPLGGDEANAYGIPPDNPFVDVAGAAAEIWAYGFRHPQQFSWDRDGRLFIADIGQGQIEEINLGVAGGNYGWRLREGTFATARGLGRSGDSVFPLPEADDANFIYPVAQYDHDEGFAVGGGYVYEGTRVPALYDKYVFTDFPRGRVFALDAHGLQAGRQATIKEVRLYFRDEEGDLVEEDLVKVAGFPNTYEPGSRRVDARIGIDHSGELYLLTKGDGWIRKLVAFRDAGSDAGVSERQDEPSANILTWRRRWQVCADDSVVARGEVCMKECADGSEVPEDADCPQVTRP